MAYLCKTLDSRRPISLKTCIKVMPLPVPRNIEQVGHRFIIVKVHVHFLQIPAEDGIERRMLRAGHTGGPWKGQVYLAMMPV